MTFANPLALLILPIVLAIAVAALFRPGRRVQIVPSLKLWQQALEQAGVGIRRRRRVSVSWLILLAGALLAGLAIAGPTWRSQPARRTVALAIYPSAELANPPGMDALRSAGQELIGRLNADDCVVLLLPAQVGGASEMLSPGDAKVRLDELAPILLPAGQLTMPFSPPSVQHLYELAPANLSMPEQPGRTTVALSTSTPELVLDALAAELLTDGTSQLLVTVRNHSSSPADASLSVRWTGSGQVEPAITPASPASLPVPPGGRASQVVILPAGAEHVTVSVGPAIGQQAELTLRQAVIARILLAGRENPDLARFVQVMEETELASGQADATMAISVGADLPEGLPGVVFDPPTPPPGWRRDESSAGPLSLSHADVLADHPLLADVDLSGAAVRLAQPWTPTLSAQGRPVVRLGDGVLMLATDEPARLYVAFDPSPANTNWPLQESFVLLLANAVRQLSPAHGPQQWLPADGEVNVIGLGFAKSVPPAIASLPLPAPAPAGQARPLWPFLAGLAGVLWLVGWLVRFLKLDA